MVSAISGFSSQHFQPSPTVNPLLAAYAHWSDPIEQPQALIRAIAEDQGLPLIQAMVDSGAISLDAVGRITRRTRDMEHWFPGQKTPIEEKTALMLAIERGREDVVAFLIGKSAPVNQLVDSENLWHSGSALTCAAARGHIGIARSLLTAGADPKLCARSSCTRELSPLIIATNKNDVPMMTLFLDHRALIVDDSHIFGSTPSYRSALSWAKSPEAVELLVARGGKINSTDADYLSRPPLASLVSYARELSSTNHPPDAPTPELDRVVATIYRMKALGAHPNLPDASNWKQTPVEWFFMDDNSSHRRYLDMKKILFALADIGAQIFSPEELAAPDTTAKEFAKRFSYNPSENRKYLFWELGNLTPLQAATELVSHAQLVQVHLLALGTRKSNATASCYRTCEPCSAGTGSLA